jgi:endonuclease G
MSIVDADLYAAAQRFQERVQQSPTEAAPAKPDQSKERTKYLAWSLSKARAQLFATEASAKGMVQQPEETIRQIANERIVGVSDLVDFNFLELALAVGRGVSRVKVGNELGTAVQVGPGLLMTNNHVIPSREHATAATAHFDYQENANHELLAVHHFRLNPSRFFVTDNDLDFTVVALEPASDKGKRITEYPWFPLIGQTGKAESGDPVNIIQHPRGGLKQISFRANCVIEIPRESKDFLYYTTDTEPGSSGSPCFNDQWEMIALHHSGVPDTDESGRILKRDKSVWRKGIDPDGLIAWIANEGARISAIVRSLQGASVRNEAGELRSRMLGEKPPNPVELARRNLDPTTVTVPVANPPAMNPPFTSRGVDATMSQSVTLTLPLQITFSIGGAATAPPVVAGSAPDYMPPVLPPIPQPDEAGAEEVTIDPDWSKRKGYNPKFLGFEVPLPALSASQLANTVVVPPQFQANNDKHLLNYFHYSVKMNQKRRCAWFSAAMIDGTQFIDFKRGKDKWFLDTRIPSKFQMGEELYAAKNTDRGHLTRFKDLSWGANKQEAVNATNDTFHFTNCALQLDDFNQSQDRWQGLELFLLEQHARKEERKMIVFTGPIFKSTDPKYRNKFMNYTAQIPLAFWKVCVLRRKNGSIAATAFTLGQEDVTDLPGFEEKLDIATAQVTIADLENLTKLSFGDLRDHDVFEQTEVPGVLEVMRLEGFKAKVRPIESFNEIVI